MIQKVDLLAPILQLVFAIIHENNFKHYMCDYFLYACIFILYILFF